MADKRGGELSHYLLLIYRKVIEQSVLKHSKRPLSDQVSTDHASLSNGITFFRL